MAKNYHFSFSLYFFLISAQPHFLIQHHIFLHPLLGGPFPPSSLAHLPFSIQWGEGRMQVKVKADSLLAMLPNARRRKHIARQVDRREGVKKDTKLNTDRMQEENRTSEKQA